MGNTAIIASREILYLPIDKIMTNPYQPRKFFDRTALEELAKSITEYGVLQPISVRLINGHSYELVAGERRLRASKLAGLKAIPAIVVNISDKDSAILAIIENLQRENLSYIEEAEGFQNLLVDYSFTQEQLAERIGKSQSAIANKLRILKLSKPVQKFLLDHQLSERHARAVLKLTDEKSQLEVLQKAFDGGLSVKRTEELVEQAILKREAQAGNAAKAAMRKRVNDMRIFTNTIKQAVEIVKNSGAKAEYEINDTENGCEIFIVLSI